MAERFHRHELAPPLAILPVSTGTIANRRTRPLHYAKGHPMSNVYNQHHQHTRRISAAAILHNGEHVASITIAHPADGARRMYAYVHWIGTQMARGSANGYGYDKSAASVASAAAKHLATLDKAGKPTAECMFWEAINSGGGQEWHSLLRGAGFVVCQVCG